MRNRVEEIKKKGFTMALDSDKSDLPEIPYAPTDFSKIKVGLKTLKDATTDINTFKKYNPTLGDEETLMRALAQQDFKLLRDISDYFYLTSGIYMKACKYLAYIYKYDWIITPYVEKGANKDKVISSFTKALNYFDEFEIKRFFGEVALKVVRHGCYIGYKIPGLSRLDVQELHPNYCRSRYKVKGRPAIEFNMRYFDDMYGTAEQRARIVNLYPEEFKKGYRLYKQGKLVGDYPGDDSGWYLLDPNSTIKFNLNGDDFPGLIAMLPAIIHLDGSRGIDRQKMQQQLLKIIIQKMPIDKNGDLVFDVDEAQALHNNAVRMLQRAIGIDVLTTFADVDVASMTDSASTTASDDAMDRAKSAVFEEGGVSSQLFNSDNSTALEKSVMNDEASMLNLIQQFEGFLNDMLEPFNKNKKIIFKAQILPSTIYNYKELAKLYKEQTQLGYSKMLPQIILGQSQSAVLSTAYFENDILDLVNVFIPPMMSSTMNADILNRGKSNGDNSSSDNVGRPTNEESGKPTSEKTEANKEAAAKN